MHPAAPERLRFAFSGSVELLRLLRRAQEVLKSKYPAGDLEYIFREALELLLDKKDPDRRLRAKVTPFQPAKSCSAEGFISRRIPQLVKDEVWRRDNGQCTRVASEGKRCPERGGLEFDHIIPFGLGGASNNPKNIRLLCRGHNQMRAREVFGFEKCRPGTAGGNLE